MSSATYRLIAIIAIGQELESARQHLREISDARDTEVCVLLAPDGWSARALTPQIPTAYTQPPTD